ncbi:MAG: aminopeptidase P family protein [Nitrospinae bacterium]|nr:aminopeptidase P family protein [Nitrospinota bacterium]
MDSQTAVLFVAASERDANLYYATRFLAPDPFIFMQTSTEKLLLMSDLELDRAKAQATVERVLSYSAYDRKLKDQGVAQPTAADVVSCLLQELAITDLIVSTHFGVELADALRERGYRLQTRKEPFFPERALKSAQEVQYVLETMRATEEALGHAIDAIRSSEIRHGQLYYQGQVLTSEYIKRLINVTLMEKECIAQHTIVACGDDACDPHQEGSGPLRPHQAIVFDVFPRSARTGYFADISRTVVKGEPSDALRRVYHTVLQGQELGLQMVKEGASGKAIHSTIVELFEREGYRTGVIDGRMQGYFHGTGHGVGLEIHEPPRISRLDDALQAGHVVTVEPGLYYLGIGGVRIEDTVVVTGEGCENLTSFPKQFEL